MPEMLAEYERARADHGLAADGLYHIDIPFSVGTQTAIVAGGGVYDRLRSSGRGRRR